MSSTSDEMYELECRSNKMVNEFINESRPMIKDGKVIGLISKRRNKIYCNCGMKVSSHNYVAHLLDQQHYNAIVVINKIVAMNEQKLNFNAII